MQTSLAGRAPAHDAPSRQGGAPRQLRFGAIVAVWAAAALPMAALAWIVAPWLADQLDGGGQLPRALIVTLTAGLAWQFVMVMALVWHEQRSLRWSVLRAALWLEAPRDVRTGRRGGRSWLVVVVPTLAFGCMQLVPGLPHPAARDFGKFLDSRAGHQLLAGSWGWLAVLAALLVLNTVLGEELLFRGYLLPRMNRVFGRRDWVANALLFGAYHLHMPWAIPASVVDGCIFAYPSKRSRSALVGIVVHSAQSVVFLVLALHVVLSG